MKAVSDSAHKLLEDFWGVSAFLLVAFPNSLLQLPWMAQKNGKLAASTSYLCLHVKS